ncbi:MAG: tetratricopeptide repeat protein [Candidatus Aminicenantales bacterium]
MKTWIFLLTTALFFLFSACAVQEEASISPSQSTDFRSCLRQGSFFLEQGKTEKAMAQFNLALQINPNSAQAHNLLGIAYFQQDNYVLAEEECRKAIELDPSYASAYNNLGSISMMNKDYDDARTFFEKTIFLAPDSSSAHFSLGTLLIIQGQVEKGEEHLLKGIELDPDFLEKNKAFIKDFSSPSFTSAEVNFTYAKMYASVGNIEKTLFYLKIAKQAGFQDWQRIGQEKEFEKVRNNEEIQKFINL